MIKTSLIAGIVSATVLTAVGLSYLFSSPFPSPGWLICAAVGAFALILVEQR